jgi:predicted nucleic acid-binding protein
MSDDFVLDASAVAKAFVVEPESGSYLSWFESAMRRGARFHAPSLLAYELAQIVVRYRARLGYPDADPVRGIVRDATEGIELDHDAWSRIDPFVDRISAYDASYLALAVAKGATLVTYDERLAAAATQADVTVLAPGHPTEPTGDS